MLTVAWNLGQGKNFEYNQGLKTSGVQPLSTIIYGVLAYVGSKFNLSKYNFPRIIILFSGLNLLIFVFVLRGTILMLFNDYDKDIILFLCIIFGLFNIDLFVSFTNGLETGIYLIVIVIAIRFYWKLINEINLKNVLAVGTLFGIAALTRIDFVIISLGLMLSGLIFSKLSFKTAFVVLILQLLIISPWLIYTYGITGSLIQSSAASQMGFINSSNAFHELRLTLLAVFQTFTLNIYTGQHDGILLIFGSIFLVIVSFLIFKKKGIYNRVQLFYLSIFISLVFLVLSYTMFSRATHFYFRYFTPVIILVLLIVIPLVYNYMKHYSLNKTVTLTILFLTVFFLHAYLYLHSGKLGVEFTLRPSSIYKNFSGNDLVGVFNSGVTGYYCQNVVNLDGKLDHKALAYKRNGHLIKYIDSLKIISLIEWEIAFPIGDKDEFFKNWNLLSDDLGDNRTVCFKRNLK
jgi:hypothetical protein